MARLSNYIRKCSNCIFGDKCSVSECSCEFYSPIVEDDTIDEIIEAGRHEFVEDWVQYVAKSSYY